MADFDIRRAAFNSGCGGAMIFCGWIVALVALTLWLFSSYGFFH